MANCKPHIAALDRSSEKGFCRFIGEANGSAVNDQGRLIERI